MKIRLIILLLLILSFIPFNSIKSSNKDVKYIKKTDLIVQYGTQQKYVITDIDRAGILTFSRIKERKDDDTDYIIDISCGSYPLGKYRISAYLYEQYVYIPIDYVYDEIQMTVTVYNNDNTLTTFPFQLSYDYYTIEMTIGLQYFYYGVSNKKEYSRYMEVAPYIEPPGRTMVPLRFIAEAFGANVEWIQETKTVNIYMKNEWLNLQIGRKYLLRYYKDKFGNTLKEKVGMDVAPYILNGRTMLPVRFVSEALKFYVYYEGKKIRIFYKP